MLKKRLGIESIEKNWVLGKGSDYFKIPPTLIIPDGCKWIGMDAFRKCKKLEKVVIPRSVKGIGNHAFWGCEGMKEVIVPEGVEYIGECAFYFCKKLEKIEIPKSVDEIGISAFDQCNNAVVILKKLESEFKFILPFTFRGCRDVKEEIRS